MAPEIAEKDFPAGASEYHWTLGALQLAGVEAAALKVAAAGSGHGLCRGLFCDCGRRSRLPRVL